MHGAAEAKAKAAKEDRLFIDLMACGRAKNTDEGLKEVAKLQKLTSLDLRGCELITDEDLKEVAKMQQLKGLNCKGTKVTSAGAAELKKALPNCYISGP